MFPLFILGLLLGGLAVIFDLQNITSVTVSFFQWHLEGSLAIILAIAVLTGIIIALLMVLPELISNYFKYRRLVKENKILTEELRKQKELTQFARKVAPTEEDIDKIEKGAIATGPVSHTSSM